MEEPKSIDVLTRCTELVAGSVSASRWRQYSYRYRKLYASNASSTNNLHSHRALLIKGVVALSERIGVGERWRTLHCDALDHAKVLMLEQHTI